MSEVQGHPWAHEEFEANVDDVKFCWKGMKERGMKEKRERVVYINEFGGTLLNFIPFHFHVLFRLGVQPPYFGPIPDHPALVFSRACAFLTSRWPLLASDTISTWRRNIQRDASD